MNGSDDAVRKPFIEHIHELRRRLLLSVAFVVVGAGIGYSINEKLLQLIQQPLGEKLYYTSPTGGFNFIFVLCLSFGLLLALPCIVYQLLAFVRPVIRHANRANMFWYPFCSAVLAALGVVFAYMVSLPAALHFLTNFGGANIESLITTDAYFRFALAYLLGFAMLFQLPLLMIIANRINPLKPSKLMKGQRYVLVGSFLIAAILTPTPDPFNQLLMAGPIVILYQFSIMLIWMINMKRKKKIKPVFQPIALPVLPVPVAIVPKAKPPLQNTPRSAPLRPSPRIISDVSPFPSSLARPIAQPIPRRSTTEIPKLAPSHLSLGRRPRNFIDIVASTR